MTVFQPGDIVDVHIRHAVVAIDGYYGFICIEKAGWINPDDPDVTVTRSGAADPCSSCEHPRDVHAADGCLAGYMGGDCACLTPYAAPVPADAEAVQ